MSTIDATTRAELNQDTSLLLIAVQRALLAAENLAAYARLLQTSTTATSVAFSNDTLDPADLTALQRFAHEFTSAEQKLHQNTKAIEQLIRTNSQVQTPSYVDDFETAVDTIADQAIKDSVLNAGHNLLACPTSQASVRFDGDSIDEPILCVPCKFGELRAGYFGDPGDYDGIYVDLRLPNGKGTQCAIVESTPDDTLHVLAWDGDNDCSVVEQDVNVNGDYVY